MAVIQCKMCGGTMDLPQGVTCGECPYCGTLTTFPKINDEHKEQLYGRAEHFRRQNDFDKAVSAYEALLNEDSSDPEAYWGLVLSRFGIEYVEDPVSHERIPTCHRVQFESILTDADYRMALENSSGLDREIYEKEAQRIAEIQKGILAISSQEKPFDVFICYKETTEGGTRTRDSVVAQEIYYQLVNAGYKVFFARITLEDKLGQQYEPYIFAALNSAKVMLAIGSKKEYFEAVWVRNEWSRFLALMKKDRSKMLIPCYQDMDAYDIPQELSMLQSQDMSKIGFIQDLLRGIKKVVNPEEAVPQADTGTDEEVTLLEEIEIFLSTKAWQSAAAYCEKVMDLNPELAQVYIYRLLAKNQLSSEDELYKIVNLESEPDFQLALRFSDEAGKQRLNAVLELHRCKLQEIKRARTIEMLRAAAENLNCQETSLEEIQNLASQFKNNPDLPELAQLRQQFVRQIYDYAVSMETENPDLAAELLGCIPEQPGAVELRSRIIFRKYRNLYTTHEDFLLLEKKYREQAENENEPSLLALADESGRIARELQQKEIYRQGIQLKNKLQFSKAAAEFSKIPDYADSSAQAALCIKKNIQAIFVKIIAGILLLVILFNSVSVGAILGISSCQRIKGNRLAAAGKLTEAAKWYRKAAEKGNAKAQNELGFCYHHGYGVEKDINQAQSWYSKAENQSFARAQYNLGQYYLSCGSPTSAVKLFRKAAEQGDAWGQLSLGYCLFRGLGTRKNDVEAFDMYHKAVEQGDPMIQVSLGNRYSYGEGVEKDPVEAVKWYRKAAERGNTDGQLAMGDYYIFSRGAAEDHAEGIKWYRKAAEQGDPWGMLFIGDCYIRGRGVAKDHTEGMKWYRKAAERGKAVIEICIGNRYCYGDGVEKDLAEAVRWYRMAADRGDAIGMVKIGDFHFKGLGVKKDYQEAVRWYRMAADRGDIIGMVKIADCHFKGVGVKKDYREAAKLYRMAAKRGYTEWKMQLGDRFYNSINPDYAEAAKVYRMSFEEDDAIELYNLGFCCQKKYGTEWNFGEAVKWCRRDAEQGDPFAKNKLNLVKK